MKIINVVGAIIKKDDTILIAQRKKGELSGMWEFPGGKVEVGETLQEALIREIREELDVNISVDRYLTTAEYDYSTFHLHMDCFLCSLQNNYDHFKLSDHSAIQWIPFNTDISKIQWVPADVQVMECLQKYFKKN